MKLNTKLLTISALFIAALMLLSPISQTNTSGGGGTNNYDLDFLNSLDINNNNFVLSADSLSDSVDINYVEVVEDNGTKKLQYTSNSEEVDKTTFISVNDVAGLNKLSKLVNDDSKPFEFSGYTIKLTKNLILDDPVQAGESNFTLIGKDLSHKFNGTFDGQGHVISNLQVSNVQYAGLFGVLGDKSTIKNLGIINSKISANVENGVAYSGGIAGNNDSGTITNCYNTGNVKATTTNGSAYSGGIAGDNDSGTITNCYNTGAVTASSNSGGIAGNNNGGTITKCYNAGVVTGSTSSGGIAGINIIGAITNCYNTGTVTSSINSGGITGWNNHGTITNCYNTGAVTAESTKENVSSGGIAGYNQGGTITNCYNTGVVSRSTSSGGIAGRNSGTIENCYNTGDVTATATATNNSVVSGGIAGENSTNGKIENCYNTGDVTATATSTNSSAYSGGVVGKNDKNSTVQSCYSHESSNKELIGNNVGDDGCKTFDDSGKFSDGSKLLDALNEWVTKANERNPDDYRYWMDPFIQNEEYPVFTDWYGEAERLNISLEKNSNGIYEIKNKHQLALIADDLNGNYVLSHDINLSGYEWRPIGNSANKFSGTFDGQGHTISNLSVKITSDSGYVYSGLFGYLDSNATVKNLGITNSVIFTNTTYKGDDRAYSGGIVGYNTGTVMNCYYTGTVIGTGAVTFGGIVGENKNGTVSNCHNTGTVIGTGTSGGIAGYNSGTVTNCYNTGFVIADTASGDANSGGIVGNNGGPITNCYNTGVVTATATNGEAFSGGITGNNLGLSGNSGTIENCYNTGTVTAKSTNHNAFSGGIAGYNTGKITNCYNTGDVEATTNHNTFSGGIAGKNDKGKITNCYNTGTVTATSTKYRAFSGGIAGGNQGKIENCYNSGNMTADSTNNGAYSGGIAGYNSGPITNCYNTGIVAATAYLDASSGGIVGLNEGGTITNCYYLDTCVSNGTDFGIELTSDEMKKLKLLGGKGSNNNLNKDKDGNEITNSTKPWSPDIFNVNGGYPILADVPTQIDPKDSANKPPQSAVYITLDDSKNVSKPTQAENYLKPFMLTGGDKVNATVYCLNDQNSKDISYQWYEMNDEGVFIKTDETSSSLDIIHGTYYVKITIDGYSYTSLTRTVLNIITVTFINDGSDVNKIETYYNETISQPEGPTKTGYEVEGWYCDSSFINEYEFETTQVTKNITLYAKWKLIEYSVEYNGNNNTSGTVPIDTNKEYTINDDIKVELNEGNLAKSGHIFRGWNYTKDASSGLPSEITLTKDVIENYINKVPNNTTLTLYAVWTLIPEPIYTLCLNSNDSTLQTKRYSGTYGTEVTLKSALDFGWNNECKFIEWNSKSDGSGVSYKEGDKFSLGSDVWNLYAIWSDSSYHTVSFDSNGGSNVSSQSVQDGYRASEPTDPVKQGHSFKHWSLNGTKYNFNQSVKEDITLKAEYEVISYKVTFYYNGDVYYSTQADYNTSLGDRMPSLPSDKDSWNTSENGKGSNFNADSLITSDISVYAVSENSITSILIIGGSAAAILAAIAAWLFMRSRYN